MAGFFDKMSDALNDAANDITNKAKEFSEVSSLNGQIRSQEKTIESTYREIGRLYYEAHKDSEEDVYIAQIRQITNAIQTAEKLRADVANIKRK